MVNLDGVSGEAHWMPENYNLAKLFRNDYCSLMPAHFTHKLCTPSLNLGSRSSELPLFPARQRGKATFSHFTGSVYIICTLFPAPIACPVYSGCTRNHCNIYKLCWFVFSEMW